MSPVKVTAYRHLKGPNCESPGQLTSDSTLKVHRMMIAPNSSVQVAILAIQKYNGIKVLNAFIVRDECYRTNPAVMQGMSPRSALIDKGRCKQIR